MSYNKTTWATGDIITAAKLNNMEDGIADAGSGAAMVLTLDSDTLAFDKTWQEIHDALIAGIPVVADFEYDGDSYAASVTHTLITSGQYQAYFTETTYASTGSASGYPVLPSIS